MIYLVTQPREWFYGSCFSFRIHVDPHTINVLSALSTHKHLLLCKPTPLQVAHSHPGLTNCCGRTRARRTPPSVAASRIQCIETWWPTLGRVLVGAICRTAPLPHVMWSCTASLHPQHMVNCKAHRWVDCSPPLSNGCWPETSALLAPSVRAGWLTPPAAAAAQQAVLDVPATHSGSAAQWISGTEPQ